MKRRDILAGLTLAALQARARSLATEAPAAESLYIPKPQRVEDLHGFDGALEVLSPRAFEEDDVAFEEVLLEPDAGLAGSLDELSGNASGRGAFDDL